MFCNLALSLAAPRRPECNYEADEETLPRFGLHSFINNIGGGASDRINSINHPVFPFEKTQPI
jgi:hypothetical protein